MIPLPVLRKGPVLIVEDDHDVRVTLRSILEDEGYEVMTATDGRHALEVLRTVVRAPMLALVDLMMPVMDGWEFVAVLRQSGALAALPVIVQSAFADRAPPAGIDGFLKKPIDVVALLALVEKYCA